MTAKFCLIAATSLPAGSVAAAVDSGPTDPQIAPIAYTADNIDIETAKLHVL
jgi:predicted outer membrane protein